MSALVLALTAFFVSFLTLFTGFGLGTLLLPAFALFFPVQVAVASTAIVHGANNVFKVSLLWKDIDRTIAMMFGIPAILASAGGAYLLSLLSAQESLAEWEVLGRSALITPVKLTMAMLIAGFALIELFPVLGTVSFPRRYLPLGGAISGFFGGLSGHQGALRAAFLGPLELSPGIFAATQAVLGLAVDIARLTVYGMTFLTVGSAADSSTLPTELILIAVVAAFAGSLLGKRLLPNIQPARVRKITGILLILVAISLGLGLT